MINNQQFEELVIDAIRELPQYFRNRMENITIHIEDLPDRNTLRHLGYQSPYAILGLYQGVPLTRRGIHYRNVMPDRITIYKRALLRRGQSRTAIKNNVKRVVIHEIGHYFGLSDAELYRIEKHNMDLEMRK